MSDMQESIEMIKLIFNEQNRQNIQGSFQDIRITIANLEKTSKTLDTLVSGQKGRLERIIFNVESISTNFKNKNAQFSNIINNFSAITDTLAKTSFSSTLAETNKALQSFNSVMVKVSNGEGTLGQLIKNDSLYSNLDSAALHLNILIKDINDNPDRYVHFSVFGKKEKKKK